MKLDKCLYHESRKRAITDPDTVEKWNALAASKLCIHILIVRCIFSSYQKYTSKINLLKDHHFASYKSQPVSCYQIVGL